MIDLSGFLGGFLGGEVCWGMLIALYLYLGGLAGGAFLSGSMAHLLARENETYRVFARSGVYIGTAAILLGLIPLILDLKRFTVAPVNVLFAFSHVPESMMSVGTWIISIFACLAVVTSILWLFYGVERKVQIGGEVKLYLESVQEKVLMFFEVVGCIFAVATMTYTGLLLSFARRIVFWGSPLLPWLFTASGVSTGLVASGLFIPIIGVLVPRLCPEFRELLNRSAELFRVQKRVEGFDIPLILGEIILVFAYLLTVAGTRGFANVVFGVLSGAFWVGFILIGLLIPIILWLWLKLREKPVLYQPVNFALIYLSFVLVLIGGFFLRYVVLFGGQL
ncbi:MAG: hypothetical protein DRO52_03635 [Candidatus Hecatellales archaeon]|nr:MAG: hypothetical protein DRO52_03635 [Candidatus Hecatellales archaeon]